MHVLFEQDASAGDMWGGRRESPWAAELARLGSRSGDPRPNRLRTQLPVVGELGILQASPQKETAFQSKTTRGLHPELRCREGGVEHSGIKSYSPFSPHLQSLLVTGDD